MYFPGTYAICEQSSNYIIFRCYENGAYIKHNFKKIWFWIVTISDALKVASISLRTSYPFQHIVTTMLLHNAVYSQLL